MYRYELVDTAFLESCYAVSHRADESVINTGTATIC